MSYLVLARKYRPNSFDEVSGQLHVTQTLQNAIKRDKVAHAYLFCGPRGVGKTSIARIFAKALNCQNSKGTEPCNTCSNCTEITAGRNIAVREIDGASHNSVDNVRELINSFRTLPPPEAKFKVYIIDEVHMLSTAAFNALLKSLEEPPANTIFILATTEPHKIIPTVLSRCQRFDLKALSTEEVVKSLTEILGQEKIKIDDASVRLISRLSEGSLRDAQSLLERVLAYCTDEITIEDTSAAIGIVAKSTLSELSKAIFNHETNQALLLLDNIFAVGHDPILFLKEFVAHWRELLLVKNLTEKELLKFGISTDEQVLLKRQLENISNSDVQDLVEIANTGADSCLRSNYLRYALEALIVRMSTRVAVADLAELFSGTNITAGKKKLQTKPVEATTAKVAANPVKEEKTNPVKKEVAKKEPIKTEPVDETKSTESINSVALDRSSEVKPPAVETANTAGDLSWESFVAFVKAQNSFMLAEYLKRFALLSFSEKELKVAGPDSAIAFLKSEENQANLQKKLCDFTKSKRVRVLFEQIENQDFLPSSLLQSEVKREAEKKKTQINNILEHPDVKVLKELFPNAQVEQLDE